jgi:hypothetical protein
VHGSLDRAKDVSSFVVALVRRDREECVRLAHADNVPLLILPEDIPLSSVRPAAWERAPHTRIGPTKTHVPPATREGYRHPVNQDAFHRCSRGTWKDCSSSFPVPASRSRRPHVAPMAGDNVPLRALQARCRDEPVQRCFRISREQVTFTTRWTTAFAFAFVRAWD